MTTAPKPQPRRFAAGNLGIHVDPGGTVTVIVTVKGEAAETAATYEPQQARAIGLSLLQAASRAEELRRRARSKDVQ